MQISLVRLSSVLIHCTPFTMSVFASKTASRASLATVCTAVRVTAIASRRPRGNAPVPLMPSPTMALAICALVSPRLTPVLIVRSMSKAICCWILVNHCRIVAPCTKLVLAIRSITDAPGSTASMETLTNAWRANAASSWASSPKFGPVTLTSFCKSAIARSSRLPWKSVSGLPVFSRRSISREMSRSCLLTLACSPAASRLSSNCRTV